MREALLAFIKATQENAGTIRRQIVLAAGGNDYPKLWFGYGYFNPRGVLYWTSDYEQIDLSNEEAVDWFLASMVLPAHDSP